MNSSVKKRLQLFLEYKRVSQSAFERTLGLAHGYVSNIRKGISPEVCSLIVHHYSELNTKWLITGEGEMLVKSANPSTLQDTERTRYIEMLKWRDGRIVELENLVLKLQRVIDETENSII